MRGQALKQEIQNSLTQLHDISKQISSENLNNNNPSLNLASWITGIPIVYYPWGLEASATRFKNSLQENAKTNAMIENVIETSHNGIVSWERSSNMNPIMIIGKDDHDKTKERWKILREYFETNGIDYKEIFTVDGNILSTIGFNSVWIYLAEAASLPPIIRVPNCPFGCKRLILFDPTYFCAIPIIAPCNDASP